MDTPVAVFVTPVLPLAGGSGRALRAWDWLQELSLTHRVHVLVVGSLDTCSELPGDYPAAGVWPLAQSTSTTRGVARLAGLLMPLLALFSTRFVTDWLHWRKGAQHGEWATALSGEPVVRIVVFRLYLQTLGQQLAARFPDATCVLDMDDLESRTRLSVASACWRMGHLREAMRGLSTAVQYSLIERCIPSRYQQLHLAAYEDCQLLAAPLRPRVSVRPNRVALPANLSLFAPSAELGLLFVGTLNYPPNEEAVRFLLRQLVPCLHLRLQVPWRLRIVGSHASVPLQQLLQNEPCVEFIPHCTDLLEVYGRSQIVLVPLFAGGGTKLKTLEGFAHARAVIATDQAVRGLAACAGEHYLLAESAGSFAEAIVELVAQPERAERIARAGWMLCHQRYARP